MKKILLFGAGKSATALIRFLVRQTAVRGWEFVVAETNLALAESKIGGPAPHVRAVAVDVADPAERAELVRSADVVISLLPPALHFLVAGSCVECGKHLLTASYLDDNMRSLEPAIKAGQLLFLCEMGLDPGIDHMSAMELIHRINAAGGRIHSFRSHTGGLVSPPSDDNPWHYKISWNPRNVVMAGSAGAVFLDHGKEVARHYHELFEDCAEVKIPGLRTKDPAGLTTNEPAAFATTDRADHATSDPAAFTTLAWYPNRDSLSYIPVYGLAGIDTFIRTTLRYPSFCRAWKAVVAAGLTDDKTPLDACLSFHAWSAAIAGWVDDDNRPALDFLGLFDRTPLPAHARTSADVLQYLLETRLAMRAGDKDMIVMLHEIGYTTATGANASVRSSLIVHGDDHLQTAMAKTVGLPLGIVAILLLEDKIALRGLHIPILPAIYEPVLHALEAEGIKFTETVS